MKNSSAIQHAYSVCKRITFTHAKTFAFASRFLPLDKRNACYAVYAFCRYVDDIVDVAMESGSVTRDDAIDLVDQWRKDLDAAYAGAVQQDGSSTSANSDRTAILLAWEHTLRKYEIPRNLPNQLIEGVLMDTVVTRFDTFDELKEYCYKVASVVGLMTTPIFGYSDPDALPRAVDLGIAMQLTNIIRDVHEDALRGRIYIAGEDLNRFGVAESDILDGNFTMPVRSLIIDYVGRAHYFYDSAEVGIGMLHRTSRPTVTLMSRNYERILRVIERRDYNVFQGRARTSLATKMLSIPVALFSAIR